jgi:hypothetical protein
MKMFLFFTSLFLQPLAASQSIFNPVDNSSTPSHTANSDYAPYATATRHILSRTATAAKAFAT